MNSYLSNAQKYQEGGTRISLLRPLCAALWGWISQANAEDCKVLGELGLLNKEKNNDTYYEIMCLSISFYLQPQNLFQFLVSSGI